MTSKVVDISKALEQRKFEAKESRLVAMKAAFAASREEAAASKLSALQPTRKTQKSRNKKRGKKS
jgi:hypothetical protein